MKLSIITINYNHLDGLRRTYESVVSQTWNDYEWIIIDGGSTDGSRDFIEEHQDKFAYWCSEPDKGVYNAMNKGIAKARGEYLNFMNSGDVFAYPTTLELVFTKPRTADILYGYMMRRTLDGIPHNIPSMKPHISWEDFYFDTLPHQSSYIRRQLFEEYGGYDETYPRLADWHWVMRIFTHHNATLEFIPHKLSVYECGGISEDEYWRDDLERILREEFPTYISANDFLDIRDLHTILNKKWSRFMYKVIRKLVHIFEDVNRKKEFYRVRFKDNGNI